MSFLSKEQEAAFTKAWAKKEVAGYKYGRDALERVRLGWLIAQEERDAEIEQLRRDLSDAVEEGDGLREALQLVASRMGTGNACQDYEDRAEEFRRATGLMAPGKSQPACIPDNDDERRAKWTEWVDARNAELRRVVTAALKTAPKAEEKKP